MLFKDEKREQIKLKAKPGVVELAELLYETAYPFTDEANLDNLFEELVVRKALELGLVKTPGEKKVVPTSEPVDIPEEDENAGTLKVGELLGD